MDVQRRVNRLDNIHRALATSLGSTDRSLSTDRDDEHGCEILLEIWTTKYITLPIRTLINRRKWWQKNTKRLTYFKGEKRRSDTSALGRKIIDTNVLCKILTVTLDDVSYAGKQLVLFGKLCSDGDLYWLRSDCRHWLILRTEQEYLEQKKDAVHLSVLRVVDDPRCAS